MGIVEANSAGALGAITAGTVVANGATLDVLNVTVLGEQLTLFGTGFSSLPTAGNLLQGRGALLFTGAGTWNGNIVGGSVTLAGNSTGGTVITNLASTSNLFVGMVVSGDGLPPGTTITAINSQSSITISSAAPAGVALSFTFTSDVVINTNSGAGIVNGVISGVNLAKLGSNALTLNGGNTFTGNLTVDAGTVVLANANTYTGATTVLGGAANGLTLNGYGTILNTSGVTVNTGALLLVDNSIVNNLLVSRLAANATITLNGANFTFNAYNFLGFTTTQSVGTIALASGQSTIQVGFIAAAVAGVTSVFGATTLSRSPGATVNFIGGNNAAGTTPNVTPLGTSSNQLIFSNLLTTNGSVGFFNSNLQYQGNQGNILQYAEVNGGTNAGDFATYTANGIAPFSNYATQIFTSNGTLNASAGDIVKVLAQGSALYTLQTTSNLSVGALLFANATTTASAVTISVLNTLTIASGEVMFLGGGGANADNIVGGQVNVGGEAIVFNNNASTTFTNINTVVSGTGGLTLGATGASTALNLPAANSITGNTWLNAGTIDLGSAASIGSGNLVVGGSWAAAAFPTITLQVVAGGGALTFGATQAVTLNNASLSFGNANLNVPVTFNGTTTLLGNNTLNINTLGGVYLNGQVTGSGQLILGGTTAGGTVLLTNASNNYSGGTLLVGGATQGVVVVAASSTVFGTSNTIGVTGTVAPTLVAGSPLTLSQNLVLNTSLVLSGTSSANGITFSGPTTLTANVTLTDSNLGTVTFSGNVGEEGGARA